jgi:hypothetical protein
MDLLLDAIEHPVGRRVYLTGMQRSATIRTAYSSKKAQVWDASLCEFKQRNVTQAWV